MRGKCAPEERKTVWKINAGGGPFVKDLEKLGVAFLQLNQAKRVACQLCAASWSIDPLRTKMVPFEGRGRLTIFLRSSEYLASDGVPIIISEARIALITDVVCPADRSKDISTRRLEVIFRKAPLQVQVINKTIP